MIKRIANTLSAMLFVMLAACEQSNTAYQAKIITASDTVRSTETAAAISTDTLNNASGASWLSPKQMTPFSFLAAMKKNTEADNALGAVTMTDDFPADWIRKEDIAGLMRLIDSQEKCSCFLNPLSSTIPTGNATIGGYASAFVDAYREKHKVSFGLYACPETNKQKIDILLKWWAKQKK